MTIILFIVGFWIVLLGFAGLLMLGVAEHEQS